MRTKLPRVKAAVYWHERWQNEDQTYSNLHINSSPESLAAYRKGVADPYWLGNLILAPKTRGKVGPRITHVEQTLYGRVSRRGAVRLCLKVSA